MVHCILKAVATGLAVAGALADTDEVTLIQRGLESTIVDSDMDEAGLAGVFAGFLGAMQLESSALRELGLADEGPALDSNMTQQCTAEDIQALDKQMVGLAAQSASMGPQALAASMLKGCTPAKLSPGARKHSALNSCMATLFNVRPQCATCAAEFLRRAASLFGGCVPSCLPAMSACKPDGGSLSKSCGKSGKVCMKCTKPYWRSYAQCVAGGPANDEMLSALDKVFTGVVDHDMEVNEAVEMVSAALAKKAEGLKLALK